MQGRTATRKNCFINKILIEHLIILQESDTVMVHDQNGLCHSLRHGALGTWKEIWRDIGWHAFECEQHVHTLIPRQKLFIDFLVIYNMHVAYILLFGYHSPLAPDGALRGDFNVVHWNSIRAGLAEGGLCGCRIFLGKSIRGNRYKRNSWRWATLAGYWGSTVISSLSSRLYRLGVSQAQKAKESGDERPRLRAL